jgi:hypothetical protein
MDNKLHSYSSIVERRRNNSTLRARLSARGRAPVHRPRAAIRQKAGITDP